eukprot:7630752-Alexandrium_andersonii.AAC.1
MVDVPVEGAPVRAGRAPDKQVRASSSQRPDDEVAVLRLVEAPEAAAQAGADVESPYRQDAQPRMAGRCRRRAW